MSGRPPKIVPYAGLRPFRTDEDYLFFGREEQTAELVRLLREQRFLAVVGRSGSGKSSLVRAGLLPEIQGGMMQHTGSAWEIAVLRPGGYPVRNLAESLVEADLYDPEDEEVIPRLLATLNHSALGLVEAFRQSDIEENANLLLVVDQFEELFRFEQHDRRAQDEAHAFVDLLLEASRNPEVSIYVVLTMRSDYLGDCAHVPGLAEAVNCGEYLIPRLDRNQLRAAIEGPAKVGGAAISYRLIQHLLNELGDEEDQLPILQHALMRTWSFWQNDHEENEEVDLRHYQGTGGMQLAISNHADEVFESLPDDRHRKVAESLFRSLTVRGEDNRGVRRPTRLDTLAEIASEDLEVLRTVIDAYRQPGVTFLMPGEGTNLEEDTIIDLSHESLMRVWQRLRRWVDDEAQSARIYQRLVDTANLWKDGKAGLYHHPDLEIALAWRDEENSNAAWAEQYGGEFENAMRFLETSEEEAKRAERAAEEARERELVQARELAESRARSARLLKRFAITVGVACLLAMALAVWAVQQSSIAQSQSEIARQQTEVARLAEAKAQEAASTAQHAQGRIWTANAQTMSEARDSFGARMKAALAVGFAGQGREELTEAEQDELPVLLLDDSPDREVAEQMLGDNSGIDLLWQSGNLAQHPGQINSVDLSRDGRLFASVSEGEFRLRVWDAVSGESVADLDTNLENPEVVGFSPDGEFLVLAGDDEVMIWRIVDGAFRPVSDEPITAQNSRDSLGAGEELGGDESGAIADFRSMAFRPDGKALALGDDEGRVYVWHRWRTFKNLPGVPTLTMEVEDEESTTGEVTTKETTAIHDGRVRDLKFQPGTGGLLATVGGSDLAIRFFDGKTFEFRGQIEGPEPFVRGNQTAELRSISFSPDGSLLAVGGHHVPVTVWDVAARERRQTLLLKPWQELTVAEASDGRTPKALGFLCTGVDFADGSGTLAVAWHQTRQTHDFALFPPTVSLFELAEDPFGKAAGLRLARELEVGAQRSAQVQLSPDAGRVLIAGQNSHRIFLKNLQEEDAGPMHAHLGRIQAVRFSRDGTRFASADQLGQVKVWDAHTGELLQSIAAHVDAVNDLQFSADGERLFSLGNKDRTFACWDLKTGKNLHSSEQPWVTIRLGISHDGKWVVPAGWDSAFPRINSETFEPEGELTASHGNRVIYSPDGRHVAVCRNGEGTKVDLTVYELDAEGNQGRAQTIDLSGMPTLYNLAFGPYGSRFAVGFTDGTVRTWQVAQDGAWVDGPSLEMPIGGSRIFVHYDETGKRLIGGAADGRLHLWDSESGERLQSVQGPDDITIVDVSPDGNILLTGSQSGLLHMWVIGKPGDIKQTVSDVGLQEGTFNQKGPRDLALARKRRLLFTTGLSGEPDIIRAWSVQAGRLASSFELKGHTTRPQFFSLSKDERWLASSSEGEHGEIFLWDLESRTSRLIARDHPVGVVALSPDGKILASRTVVEGGGDPRPILFWDLEDAAEGTEPIAQTAPLPHNINDLVFTADGKQLLVPSTQQGGHYSLFRFDRAAREVELVTRFADGSVGRPTDIALSEDGKFFVTCATNGSKLMLWDLESMTMRRDLPNTRQWDFCTALSPDGSLVASGGGGSQVKVFRTDGSGELVGEYQGPSTGLFDHVSDLVFDSDNRTLFLGFSDGRVLSWSLPVRSIQIPAARYRHVLEFDDPSAPLKWNLKQADLGEPGTAYAFTPVGGSYLSFLQDLGSDLEQKKALFRYYVSEQRFRAALTIADSLEKGDAEPLWPVLSSSLGEALLFSRAMGEREKQGWLRSVASTVFERQPPGFKLQVDLLFESGNWEGLVALLRKETKSQSSEGRAEAIETLFTELEAYMKPLAARLDALSEGDPVLPPREVLQAAVLYQTAIGFLRQWKEDPWQADSTLDIESHSAQVLDYFQASERVPILPAGSRWHYFTQPGSPGPDWKDPDTDLSSGWESGPAPIGYGSLSDGASYGTRFNSLRTKDTGQLAYYFRTEFETSEGWQAGARDLAVSLQCDDGLVLYLDGKEVLRYNMPAGEVTPETTAQSVVNADDKKNWIDLFLPEMKLRPGRHTLAAEVHQFNDTSSDILLDLSLSKSTSDFGETQARLSAAREFLISLDPSGDALPWLSALGDDPGRESMAEKDPELGALAAFLLAKLGQPDRALALADRRIASLADSYEPALVGERKRWLNWKLGLLRRMARPETEIDSVERELRAIPPRDPSLSPKLIDLTNYYTRSFYYRVDEAGIPETFVPRRGISYDLRGAIELNSGLLRNDKTVGEMRRERFDYEVPDKVEGIAIGQKAEKLHFLGNTFWGQETEAVEVGKIIIHYEDGTSAERPLIFLEDVVDWWAGTNKPSLRPEVVAWENPRPSPTISLAELTWKNPHPEKTIATLDFVSALKKAAPFLVAITAE